MVQHEVKKVMWELRTMSLNYSRMLDPKSSFKHIVVTLFKRKCKVAVTTTRGTHTTSFPYSFGLPRTWDEVSQLYSKLAEFFEKGPSLWRAVPHPQGVCCALKDWLFEPPTKIIDEHPDIDARLMFRTSQRTPVTGTAEFNFEGGTKNPAVYVEFTIPTLLVIKALKDAGCRLASRKVRVKGNYEVINDFRSLSESRAIWVFVESRVLDRVEYVPLLRVTEKEIRGLKYLEELTDGTVQI